jgi:hypothetical protein
MKQTELGRTEGEGLIAGPDAMGTRIEVETPRLDSVLGRLGRPAAQYRLDSRNQLARD